MFKIIFSVIFTYFFAKLMTIFFDDEYSGFSKKIEIKYIVKQDEGILACTSENIYKKIQSLYQQNDIDLIKNEINNKNCILLKKGEELEAVEGICDVYDKNVVKLFKSKKVFLQKIYIPCFAVEIQNISESSEDNRNINNNTSP